MDLFLLNHDRVTLCSVANKGGTNKQRKLPGLFLV